MTIACAEISPVSEGVVTLRPRDAGRLAYALAAQAAAEARDAKVYSLVARRAREADLDAEFEMLAGEAREWASETFEAGLQTWPAE